MFEARTRHNMKCLEDQKSFQKRINKTWSWIQSRSQLAQWLEDHPIGEEEYKPDGDVEAKVNFMLAFHRDGLLMISDTFHVKDVLTAAGGKWHHSKWQPMQKGWRFPVEMKSQVLDALN